MFQVNRIMGFFLKIHGFDSVSMLLITGDATSFDPSSKKRSIRTHTHTQTQTHFDTHSYTHCMECNLNRDVSGQELLYSSWQRVARIFRMTA